MAERAHPDNAGFKDQWTLTCKFGCVPWFTVKRSQYRKALYWRYRWANKYCSNRDVLDVPCGVGWGTSRIQGAKSVIGVDIDNGAIAEATRRYGQIATFVTGSMRRLAFPDCRFGVVICLEGIEHVSVEDGDEFLAECQRVLIPGGLLLMSSPYCANMTHSGNPYHLHEYRPAEIIAKTSRCFITEELITKSVDNLNVLYMRCRVVKS